MDAADDNARKLANLRTRMAKKHVRSSVEKKAAEEIANRDRCEDFALFKPLFERIQKELDSGLRETRPFEMKAEIEKGRFFIVGGQKAYVAEKGEVTINDQGRTDGRCKYQALA